MWDNLHHRSEYVFTLYLHRLREIAMVAQGNTTATYGVRRNIPPIPQPWTVGATNRNLPSGGLEYSVYDPQQGWKSGADTNDFHLYSREFWPIDTAGTVLERRGRLRYVKTATDIYTGATRSLADGGAQIAIGSDNQPVTALAGSGRAHYEYFGTAANRTTFLIGDPRSGAADTNLPTLGLYNACTTAGVLGTLSFAVRNSGTVETIGDVKTTVAGRGIHIKSGSNARIGTGATMTDGVVTVANTSVTANTHVIITKTAHGGTSGVSYVVTKTAGTNFVITSTNADGTTATGDTSTFDWLLVERS
jgi:hypothetical protein